MNKLPYLGGNGGTLLPGLPTRYNIHIYIQQHIYIYMCVCVCVFMFYKFRLDMSSFGFSRKATT